MNLLFAGYWQWNAGSSHVISNYVKLAHKFNCEVKISSQLGYIDKVIPSILPTCDDFHWADHVVLVFETDQFLSQDQIALLSENYSRNKVTIIDPDGRYSPTIEVNGDTNHDELSHLSWSTVYEHLSNCILQPKILNLPSNTYFFPYFGMEAITPCSNSALNKIYTIQYVGSNWHRWNEVEEILKQVRPIRNKLGRIAFKGMWWDGIVEPDYASVTQSDVEFLKSLNVEISNSVPFEMVISSMGESIFSPIFIRPMIAGQYLITPRMFETICADTIPLIHTSHSYVKNLYGPGFDEFIYGNNLADRLLKIMSNLQFYISITNDIKQGLFENYNYSEVFGKLLHYIVRQ